MKTIVLIILFVTILSLAWFVIVPVKERFDFWSDLSDFVSQWGKAFVCSAVASCNNCGEDGTMPCAGCNDNPSDCLNSTAPDPGQYNWCKYFFSTSDPRSTQDCPDITSQLGPSQAYALPASNTDWFCTQDAVVRWTDGGLQCLANGDMQTCITPYDTTSQGCCDTIIANYAPGFVDNVIASPAANFATFQSLFLKGWPTNALRIGTFIVYVDTASDALCFQTIGKYLSDGTPLTCGLVPSSNPNKIQFVAALAQPVYQNAFLDMAYAFFIGDWLVFINVMSRDDTSIANCLCFMKNTYMSKPSGNRNVCAILPFSNPASIVVIPNPMYDASTNVDFLKITNINNNKYSVLPISPSWLILNDPANSNRFLMLNTSLQTAFSITYAPDTDQYFTAYTQVSMDSVASYVQTNLLQPAIPKLSCGAAPPPPPRPHGG
jgi:hypothetical protein